MTVFTTLAEHGVVPVIAIDDAKDAIGLADALLEGGLPVAEITFRTEAARDSIEAIAAKRPELLVGAGTVLSETQARNALDAGARFALAPGLDAEVVNAAKSIGLPFAPGVMTPSDLQAALRLECLFLKFFPAVASGGPAMLRNISAPFLHKNIGFNPTGGVSLGNLSDWLSMPQVRAVGGTWIAKQNDISEGNWDRIKANAHEAVSRVKKIRSRV